MEFGDRILVTGARGLIGSALVHELSAQGFTQVITPTHKELDLSYQEWTEHFFSKTRIDYIFHCAGRVGGILANSTEQYQFLYENIMIAANVIAAAKRYGSKKLLFLGSSCIYPRLAGKEQLIREDMLMSGPLEPTNEGYAIAKIVGLKLCQFLANQSQTKFVTAMLTNAYGPRDNFDLNRAHIIPAMMHRFHQAKKENAKAVEIWGTGSPVREFLHSRDVAKGLITIMLKHDTSDTINLGCGEGISVSTLAELMRKVVGLQADIVHDLSKPEGTPRKILNIDKITALGWKPETDLIEGLSETYRWAVANNAI